MLVTSAQCIFGTEKHPDAGISLNYDDYEDSQCYGQIRKKFSRASTKGGILKPFITDDDFRSTNVSVVTIGYNLYIFDIRYQQNFTASELIKVEFIFEGVFRNDLSGYVLVSTNILVSLSSDGQRYLELI